MAGSAARQGPAERVAYKSPRHAQVWFLRRSRDNWKRKYQALKADAKRLRNRAASAAKSRDGWRARAFQAERLLEQFQRRTAASQAQPQDPPARAGKRGAR
jgi:hypothetical protein